MSTTILSSTLLLTLLLAVGLVFFIRASTKDRTQQLQLIAEQAEESLLTQLQQYLQERSYRVIAVDTVQKEVTFQGFVRPSWFLTIFLSLLAVCGTLCLALVLSMLFPQLRHIFPSLVLLSPAAGLFYWQKAGRSEQVFLKVEPITADSAETKSLITVTAHRDELAAMQQALHLNPSG